ncbi:MAG: tetratricopeptide repeat protein [Magnetococcales bacterium]|nr:tetratricopeptide repeat protein [Magnetococcales bacterium]
MVSSDQLLLLLQNRAFQQALEVAEQLLCAFPDHAALKACVAACALQLAAEAQQQGSLQLAESYCRRLLSLEADHAEGLFRLAYLLQEQHHADAETCYRRLIERHPDHSEAWYNLANLLQQAQRLPEARAGYQQVVRLQPNHAKAWNNLGLLLQRLDLLDEARFALQEAVRLAPEQGDYWANLGNLLLKNGHNQEAATCYRHALKREPHHPVILCNYGILLQEQRRLPEAEQCYRQLLERLPDHGEARWHLALLLLQQGRYQEGWQHYEARFLPGQRQHPPPSWPFPQWQAGESVAGLSLLLLCEQGFGDTIQFCRFVSRLRQEGVRRVTMLCPTPLYPLLQGLPGIDLLLADPEEERVPPHDRWLSLMSLPHRLALATEAALQVELPYLAAAPERLPLWQAELPAAGIKLGLLWQGSAQHRNDRHRSIPSLTLLAPLWQMREIRWVSLQMGGGEAECAALAAQQPLLALGSRINDFADTAAIISQLQGVVTVDSAVAHLCAALGKPCWLLLPRHSTDWRWLLARSDSPWYPGVMRLFRQQQVGKWDAVILELVGALRQALATGILFNERADSTHPDPDEPECR